MKIRTALVAAALTSAATTAAPAAHAATGSTPDRHACTRTSSHHCIKGGQLCPKAKYGHSGWDAQGHRYVCKGNHQHPHWMKP